MTNSSPGTVRLSKDILADKRPDVKVFDKGKAKRSDIEAEFKKHKQNIDFDRFAVRVP